MAALSEERSYRLDPEVLPKHYELYLAPDLKSLTYQGRVLIEVELKESKEAIELHALELSIKDARLDGESAEVSELKDLERIRLSQNRELPRGSHSIEISFSGKINEILRGPYKSVWEDEAGKEHYLIATHFEPTDCRRAFPCFDEPDKKATFSISVELEPHLEAVSNWPIEEVRTLKSGKKLIAFEKTIPMSTYLVAFVIGELVRSEPVYFKDVPIRVVHVPGKEGMSSFALEVARHSLSYFADYFAIPYPGKKLDLIALPDFAFGAMENLGAVTFRETALLVKEDSAARTELERVADVVAHELAHMWFGDLVTMKWWNGIWLNEAFATFMELLAVDDFRPQWRRWVTFGLSREGAMAIDGLPSTRPIEYPVNLPAEAEGMFDAITYQKGAAVLRMLEQYLSPQVFKEGIRAYLNKFIYSNAETSDLWTSLEEAAKKSGRDAPVEELMHQWVFQGGHPVVEARKEKGTLHLSARAFNYLGKDAERGNIGSAWLIPVTLRTGSEVRSLLLPVEGASVEVGEAPTVVNAEGWGFFRVLYSEDLLKQVLSLWPELKELERFNILTDTFALALSGDAPLNQFLSCLEAAVKAEDTDPDVMTAIEGPLVLLERVADEAGSQAVRALTIRAFRPLLEKLGLEASAGEPEIARTARAVAFGALGLLGKEEETIARAREMFEQSLSGRPIPPDLEQEVLDIVAANGSMREFEAIRQRYREASTPQEEQRAMYALARFEEPGAVEEVLSMTLGEFRTQNAAFVLAIMLTNQKLQERTWSFIEEHWDEMLSRYPVNTFVRMLESVRTCVGRLGDDALATRISGFLRQHPVPSGEKAIAQSLDRLAVNVSFGRRLGKDIAALCAPVLG